MGRSARIGTAGPRGGAGPDRLLAFVLIAGFLFLLAANLPGHMSYDSAAQLHEGRARVRETWGPVLYAWLLGFFDRIVPGTALYVVASALLFFASLRSLARLSGGASWLGAAVVLLVVLTPQVLIYQAIVWKDVMFANAAVAGMTCVANAARIWDRPPGRWAWLVAALPLLAAAALVRQNGLLVALFASLALAWIGARGRWWRGAVWGVAAFAAVLVTSKAINLAARPPGVVVDSGISDGLRIVQTYDIAGAVALDRTYRLTRLHAVDPDAAVTLQNRAAAFYSGERIDFLDRDAAIGDAFNRLPNDVVGAQWLDLVLNQPLLYLRVRYEDFRWVFLTPVIDRCLPAYVGVDAPPALLAKLDMPRRWTTADQQMLNYWSWFLDTPAYSHAAYAALALALAILLLLRRRPPDVAVAALLLSGCAFAASFFVISIACDYRYLYFTDLAALAGLVYVAGDLRGLLPGRR